MPTNKRVRVVMSKLILKLLDNVSIHALESQNHKRSVIDAVIVLAASIGTLEGKPMTAAKMSSYLGLPRPTVIRRVSVLISGGILMMNEQKQILLTAETNNRAHKSMIRLNKPEIIRAAAMLSKMDTEPIAPEM